MKTFFFIRRSLVRPVIRAGFSIVGLLAVLSFSFCKYSTGQIICILCYDQNDSISSGVNNLLVNGSFEDNNCIPNMNNSTFCPNSTYYSCNISDWTCTGGGTSTYASIWDNTYTIVQDGNSTVYFGNNFCYTCSPAVDDTSCLISLDCTVTGVPANYPASAMYYGGGPGVSLAQTVSGLIPGNAYVLEFWAGGESIYGGFPEEGLFAVDVGFGDTLLRCAPSSPGDIAKVYIVEFYATSSSHTIKFTNWGHICYSCTELILDNVRLYTIAELSSTVSPCGASSSSTSFAASDTDLCEKFCISFFDSSGNNPTAWEWHFPGGSPSSSTDQNPASICYTTPGIYDVTLITTNANGNDTLTLFNYVTVYPTPPFPTIVQVGYTLTSSPANGYQWQFNSVDIPGATNQSYTVLQSGYYTIVISDPNGCKNSLTQYVLIIGIDDPQNEANLFIYPNPSGGTFTIELLSGEYAGDVSIAVVNTFGQKVFSSLEKISAPGWKKEIDLSKGTHSANDMTNGVYFIEIKTKNNFLRSKIIIAN